MTPVSREEPVAFSLAYVLRQVSDSIQNLKADQIIEVLERISAIVQSKQLKRIDPEDQKVIHELFKVSYLHWTDASSRKGGDSGVKIGRACLRFFNSFRQAALDSLLVQALPPGSVNIVQLLGTLIQMISVDEELHFPATYPCPPLPQFLDACEKLIELYPNLSFRFANHSLGFPTARFKKLIHELKLRRLSFQAISNSFTIVCEDPSPRAVIIPADYRKELCEQSPAIDRMLGGGFKEAQTKSYVLEKVPYAAFLKVLGDLFNYRKCKEMTSDTWEHYQIANYLGLSALQSEYEDHILRKIDLMDFENLLRMLDFVQDTDRATFFHEIYMIILKNLRMPSVQFKEEFLKRFNDFVGLISRLNSLDLTNLGFIENKDLECLKRMRDLKTLRLDGCIQVTCIPSFENQLIACEFWECIRLTDVSFLFNNPTLVSLSIRDCPVVEKDLHLERLPALAKLELRGCLAPIRLPPNLRVLNLDTCTFSSAQKIILPNGEGSLPLEKVFLENVEIDGDTLKEMIRRAQNSLRKLNLNGCLAVDETVLELISHCPCLENLYLKGCKVTNEELIQRIMAKSYRGGGFPIDWHSKKNTG